MIQQTSTTQRSPADQRTLVDPFAPPGTWTRTAADTAFLLLFLVMSLALAGVLWAMLLRSLFYLKERRFLTAPRPIKALGIGTSGVKLEYDETQDRQLRALSDRLDTIFAKHDLLSDRLDALEDATEASSDGESGEADTEQPRHTRGESKDAQ